MERVAAEKTIAWKEILIISLLVLFTVNAAWFFLPNLIGDDWAFAFRPAAQALLEGRTPYSVDQFLLAPWSLLLFIPLSWLPNALAMAILRVAGLIVFAYVAYKLQAKIPGMIAILLSPQALHCLLNGNVDWLALLGFVLPPQIGLFFLAIKPQIGIGLAIYWAYEAFQQKRLVKTFLPVTAALLVSFLLFGIWPLKFNTVHLAYDINAWPLSLPFGIALLAMSLHRKKIRIARGISPLLSPHVMFHSWVTVFYALAPDTIELILAVIGSWVMVGILAVR